ncbi:TonB-dependent receptor [Sandaracinobacteroides saxicola]|uniref:TonB-dependent receptor n=1 Tax=Sandaracinobacteroides saxicola TaxID=2759707 RepID=A0A7G5IMC3_9SPHN|nr:TonB-dependent receptor [Sandaracinobacteroides saxicola]
MALLSGVAQAQTPAPTPAAAAAEAADADTIVVTGSRIARPDLESVSPVAVVSSQEIALKGTVNVEEVLNELPQFIPSQTAFSNNPGDGAATIDLRGLGAGRTLVLVNGRRWVSYDVTQLIDLNTIPAALIESTQVLTGGSSAVYGSDAISGVVNFIMKKDFQGVQLDAQYRITGRGDGGTFNANATIGGNFADGKGNATLFIGYIKRDPIFQGEREFSRRTVSEAGDGTTFFGGSGSVPGTRFTVPSNPVYSSAGIPAPLVPGNNLFLQNGSTRPYSGTTDAFNFAPDNYLQLPQERWLIGGFANYEVNEHLDFYTELAYINNRVPTQLAATPISGNFTIPTTSSFYAPAVQSAFQAIDAGQVRSITNNTFLDAPNDGRITIGIGRRMQEVGPRISSNERQAFRILMGVRGAIAGDWGYDAYYSYSRTTALESQFGNVSRSRFSQALLGCPTGSAAGCAPLNIFGPGNISPAAANFVKVDTKNQTTIAEQVANFAITNGNLFDLGLGASPVAVSIGGEYRSVRGQFAPDFILSSGDVVGFNGGQPTGGGYNIREVFGELKIPILADRPFFHSLELSGAARYSDYSNSTGGVFTYAYGGSWAPVKDIRFRGQYQRAIRGPTIFALFQGSAESFPAFTDYCRLAVAVSNSTLNASCRANGVPAALIGTSFGSGNSQIRATVGGNPNLKEETSDTFSVGTVIQPSFVPGLSITVDYYNVKIKDAFFAPGATNIRDACFGTAANGYQPFDTSFCALIPRDPVNFEVDRLVNLTANSGFLQSRGIDFEVRYGMPLDFGVMGAEESRLNFRLSGTRLLKYLFNPLAGIPDLLVDCTGRFGGTCGDPYAKWRGSFSTTFISGPFTGQVRLNYVGPSEDDETQGPVSVTKLKGRVYTDLSFSWDINDRFAATFGASNLFDLTPPIIGDLNNQQMNTYPSTYDPLGRRFFVGLRSKF